MNIVSYIWHLYFLLKVYKMFQPLMLCMSHKGTLNTVDDIVTDYAALLQLWKEKGYLLVCICP